MNEERSKNRTGTKIYVVFSIIVILGLLLYIFKDYLPGTEDAKNKEQNEQTNQVTTEPLIKVTESKEMPESGIIGEVKLLGKNINTVLAGYTKGKDYTTNTHDAYNVYTFDNVDYGIGTHSSLMLFAEQKSESVSLIEYDFLVSDGGMLTQISVLSKLEEDITNTYNTDAYYMYKNGTNGYYKSGGYSELEYIMWTTDTIRVTLMFLDYNPDTNPSCNLFFEIIE